MPTIIDAKTAVAADTVRINSAPVITLKGRGKAQREVAYMQIAPLSFIENISRVESIANLAIAIGKSPTEAELKAAQSEWVIGRVASRLPAGEFTKGCEDDNAKLEFARKIVLNYAAPPAEGKQARKLRVGQLGRRTPMQHRVVRAAEEAWSLVKAELGLGKAQTLKERNASKAKRSTNANPKRGDGKGAKADKGTLLQLATPAAPVTPADYVQHMQTQVAALIAFDKKHAAKRPTTHSEFAEALIALGKLGNTAASLFAARQDAAKAA